jgi:hypothetical protein
MLIIVAAWIFLPILIIGATELLDKRVHFN